MSPLPLPLLPPLFSHSSLFSLFFHFLLLLVAFTEATVVINCTKEDYDGFDDEFGITEWSKSLGLELAVGDVITDVKLVCSSQYTFFFLIHTVQHVVSRQCTQH